MRVLTALSFSVALALVTGAAAAARPQQAPPAPRVDYVVNPAVQQKFDRQNQSIDYFVTFRWRDAAGEVHAESILAGTLWPHVEETKETGRHWDRTEGRKVWRPAPAFAELAGERKPSDYQLVQLARARIERDSRYWSPHAPGGGAGLPHLAFAAVTVTNRAERPFSVQVLEWQSETGSWAAGTGRAVDCPVGAMVGLAKAIGRPKAHAIRYRLVTESGAATRLLDGEATTEKPIALAVAEPDLPEVASVRGSTAAGQEWCYDYRVPPGAHSLVVRVHNEANAGDLACSIEDSAGRVLARSTGAGLAEDACVAAVARGEVLRIRVDAPESKAAVAFRCEFRAIPHAPLLEESAGTAALAALSDTVGAWERAWRRGKDFSLADGAFAFLGSLGEQLAVTFVARVLADDLRRVRDVDWAAIATSDLRRRIPDLARLSPLNAALLADVLDRLLERIQGALRDPAELAPERIVPPGSCGA